MQTEQANLLGNIHLSELYKYQNNEACIQSEQDIMKAMLMLNIHNNFRILYSHNLELLYCFVNKNQYWHTSITNMKQFRQSARKPIKLKRFFRVFLFFETK